MPRTKISSDQLDEIANEKLDSDLTAIGDLTTTGVLVRQSEGNIIATNELTLDSVTVGGVDVATETYVNDIRTTTDALIVDVSKRERGYDPDNKPAISWTNVDSVVTFTLTGTFNMFINGHKFVIEGDSIAVPHSSLVEGVHFIYYIENNGAPELIISTTAWSISYNMAPTLVFYWNDTDKTILGDLGYELHQCIIDWLTHYYLHFTRGTAFISGFGLSGYTLNDNATSSITFGVSDGSIADEDIIIHIAHSSTPSAYFEQVLTDPAQIPVYYRTGTLGYWRKSVANDYSVLLSGGSPAYNNYTGSAWDQAATPNNYYCAYFIFATNMITEPVIAIQGQRSDSSLNDCKQYNTVGGMNLGNWFAVEFKLLYRIIYLSKVSDVNPIKGRIVDIEDYRGSSSTGNVAIPVQDHGQLAGLSDLDHPASAIRTDTLNFNGLLTGTDDTVQDALDTLDNHDHTFTSLTSKPTTLSGFGITDGLLATNGTATNLQINAVRYRQAADQSAGSGTVTLNYNNGDYFKVTATGDITIALSNIPSGFFINMYLECINFGAWSIGWPSGIQWAGGVAPALTTTGKDMIGFTIDKNNVIMGSLIGRDVK